MSRMRHKDILELQVAVDNRLAMQMLQSREKFTGIESCAVIGEFPAPLRGGGEREESVEL